MNSSDWRALLVVCVVDVAPSAWASGDTAKRRQFGVSEWRRPHRSDRSGGAPRRVKDARKTRRKTRQQMSRPSNEGRLI
jgi:hypothetical protein